MQRFRALNDEDSSCSEAEDDTLRNKPTRESLEEDATALYNKALHLLCDSKSDEATLLLEEILDSAYLNEDEEKSSLQIQMKLGCLKNLSMIYSADEKRLESAQQVLLEAVEMDPNNVTLWSRLGHISMKLFNYSDAYYAFQEGLKRSPHHWICIENLVTLAYVLGDYISCLHYCALGLEKDSNFIRGSVFRDEILDSTPLVAETGKAVIDNWEILLSKTPYDPSWKIMYLNQARQLIQTRCDTVVKTRCDKEQEVSRTVYCADRMKNFTLAELCQTVFDFKEKVQNFETPTFSRPIDMSGCLRDRDSDALEENPEMEVGPKNISVVDDSSITSNFRCRSGSDEKGANENDADNTNQACVNGNTRNDGFELQRTMGEDDLSQSQQSQDAQEPEPKKKSRKDVKWWQYEGKRRSQRVRGHLMSVSQSPSKNERGFSETLKNLIPASLLCGEADENEEELSDKQAPEELGNYFGYQPEIDDVKKFIALYGKTKFMTVITHLAPFLCQLTNCNTWPHELVTQYLESCRQYRLYRKEQCEWMTDKDESIDLLKQDALIALSVLEFRLDICPVGKVEYFKYDSDFVADMSYLEIVVTNGLRNDRYFLIRYYWFLVKYELALAQVGLGKYRGGLYHLMLLENLLKEDSNYTMKLATKTDNIVSLEEIRKKIRFVKKMKNISRISELYLGQQYEALIDILPLCLTSEDNSSTDLVNRFYLAESYYSVGKHVECIAQCIKIVNPCLKNRNDEILGSCLRLIESICVGDHQALSELPMREKRVLTNAMIRILTSNENKGVVPEGITVTPWCILHSILFNLESNDPALYLDEETAPNSVILLQFAHEFLNRSNKCCVDDGKLLTYTIDCLSAVAVRDSDSYRYEETKHCIEQAIFCLYSHPSKKSKLKYLTEHSTPGIELKWSRCLQLYEYYKPMKIPEFDSYLSVSSDVEVLFQRILSFMPAEVKPREEDYEDMKLVLEGKMDEKSTNMTINFPPEYIDIYYLLGDHYFKTKEWIKSVEYYTYDLTVMPSRFDSWAAIALAKAEMISSKLNACESYKLEDVIGNADVVVNCFRQALDLEPESPKIRIEFGSFVYAMHSFCSRLLKGGTEPLSLDKFEMVESKKDSFLKAASKCFEMVAKHDHLSNGNGNGSTEDNKDEEDDHDHDELWIHHYMLGKVLEKIDSTDPDKFLTQYEMAGNRIREQGAPYPAKINFYNPPELAVEALEIYYRIHASILNYVEKHEYDLEKEILLSGFLERAEDSAFVKAKQSRGGGVSETNDRKRKSASDDASKKGQAEINSLMQELIAKVENMVASSESSDSSSNSDDDNDDATSVTSSQASTLYSSDDDTFGCGKNNDLAVPKAPVPVMHSFGLSAFQEKMREKEIQDSKNLSNRAAASAITTSSATVATSTLIPLVEPSAAKPVVALVSTDVDGNKYYKDFKEVKYGKIIARCLAALEECIIRFPQHHKSYFRIACTYSTLTKNNSRITKDYLIGNPTSSSDKKKICGLFSDRKANNFFNGIWRNPIDDIDRPGSFPYHMSRTVQHLLEVLDKLNDHQLLAEVGIALSKVPEQDKQYLYNSERQQFSLQAFSSCVGAAKRFFASAKEMKDAAVSVFETYQKLQKFNAKENVLANVLLDCYKQYLEQFGQTAETTNMVTLEQAFKFFQHVTWASKTNPNAARVLSAKNPSLGASSPVCGSILDNTSLISNLDSLGNMKGIEPRKKKDKPVDKVTPKLQPVTALPTVSTPSIAGAWNRLDKNFEVPVARKKTKPIQNDVFLSGSLYNPLQGALPTLPQLSVPIQENIMLPSVPPPRQSSVAHFDNDEPEIIMDLSQNKNVNGQLKRQSSTDLEEMDPISLTTSKKPFIKKNTVLPESIPKDDVSFALNNILSKMPITTSSATATATSGGIPFELFMDCMNKKPRSFDSLVETLSKQPNVQVPLEYVMTCANSGLPSTLLSNSSQSRTSTTTTTAAQVQEVLQNIAQKCSSSNRNVSLPKSTQPQQQYKQSQTFSQSSCSSKEARDRNKKLTLSTPSLNTGTKITSSSTHTLGRLKSAPIPVSSYSASRNTSPFKAQSTIVSNPGVDEFSLHQTRTTIPHEASPTPPPAHAGHLKNSEWGSSGDEPDVIDLTTPPRDKTDIPKNPNPESSERNVPQKSDKDLYFMPKPTSSAYPLPPKKKLQARSTAMSRESSEEPEVVVLD